MTDAILDAGRLRPQMPAGMLESVPVTYLRPRLSKSFTGAARLSGACLTKAVGRGVE